MAFTTLVSDFVLGVSTTLQDINPQYRRWGEREIVRYLNFGQLAFATYVPQAFARTDAIQLVAGSRQDITTVPDTRIKPGDGSTPVLTYGVALIEVIRNMGTNGQTPGRSVRLSDRYTLDVADPNWHTAPNVDGVIREVVADARQPRVFYVYPPVPTSPAVWVEASWVPEPPRVPAGGAPGGELYLPGGPSTQLLGVPDQFVDDLHHYVVAVALLKGSKNNVNVPKAQVHAGIFNASINAKAAALGGVSPNLKALPFVDQIAGGA